MTVLALVSRAIYLTVGRACLREESRARHLNLLLGDLLRSFSCTAVGTLAGRGRSIILLLLGDYYYSFVSSICIFFSRRVFVVVSCLVFGA